MSYLYRWLFKFNSSNLCKNFVTLSNHSLDFNAKTGKIEEGKHNSFFIVSQNKKML